MRTEAGSAPRGSRARAGFSSAGGARRKRSALARDAASSRFQMEVQDPRRPPDLTGRDVHSAKLSARKTSWGACPTVTPQRRAAAFRPRPPRARPAHFPPIPEVGLGALARGSSRSSRPPHTFELYLRGARAAGERAPRAPRRRCSSTRKPGPRSQGQGPYGLRHVPRRAPAGPGPRRRAPISVSGSKRFRSQRAHRRGRW